MSTRSEKQGLTTAVSFPQGYVWLVPAVYALFGVLWILFTDKLVAAIATSEAQLAMAQLWKGWFYILITTVLLAALLRLGAAREKAQMRRLADSEHKFRLLFEESRHGIVLVDAETGHIADCNPEMERLSGRAKTEMRGKSLWELCPAEFQDSGRGLFLQVVSAGRGSSGELSLEHPDGSRVEVDLAAAVVALGGRRYVLGVVRDVTAQKHAEQLVKESEEKFRTVAEQMLLGIAIVQEDSLKYVNSAFRQIYGIEENGVLGKPLAESLRLVHEDDRDRVADIARRRLRGEPDVPATYEYRGVTSSGEVKWLRAFSKLITYEGRPATLQAVMDITAQKVAEKALRAEKERAQMYLNLAPVMFIALDSDGKVTLANEQALEVLGCPARADVVGKDWFEHFIPAKNREEVKAVFAQLLSGEIEPVEYYENTVKTFCGEERLIEWRNTMLRDDRGRPVGTLSAGVDVTGRREIEEALRESESKFRSLFGTMTDGVAIHEGVRNDAGEIIDFVIRDVNPAFEQLLGLRRQQLVGSSASETYGPVLREHISECAGVAESGVPARFEVHTQDPENYLSVKCFAPRKGWIAVVIDDVTEARIALNALWEEKEVVSRIMETSPAGIIMVNKQGRITYVNAAAEGVLGLDANDIVGRQHNDPEWKITDYEGRPLPESTLPFTRVMASGRPVTGVRHAIEWPNGRRTLLNINAAPLRSASGEIEGMVAAVEDVTAQVKAQEELRRSEERLQGILRSSPAGIGLLKNRMLIWTNEYFRRMTGYTAGELEGQSARMLYATEEEFERVGEVKYAQIEAWGVGVVETQWCRKDGSVIDLLLSSTHLNPDKPEEGTLFTAMDITDLKAAERALRESERASSILISNLPGVVYRCRLDRDWTMEFVSDGITALAGYEPTDLIENQRLSYNDLIHPDDRERIWSEVAAAVKSRRPFELEYRIVTGDGAVKHVWEQGRAVPRKEGEVKTLEGYIVDVTERQLLERERDQYRRLAMNASDIILRVESGKGVTFANPAFELVLGYSPSDFPTTDSLVERVHEDDRGQMAELLSRARKGEPPASPFSVRFRHKDDGPVYLEVSANADYDETGKLVGADIIARDVTKLREMQQELAKSEELYRNLVENAFDGIYLLQGEKFLYTNSRFEEMTGYTIGELNEMGFAPKKLFPEGSRKVVKRMATSRQDGQMRAMTYELQMRHKSGKLVDVEVVTTPVTGYGPMSVLGIVRDISERVRTERALEASRRELRELARKVMAAHEEERARVSHEIHDELAQMLTALRIDLSSIMRRIPQEKEDVIKRAKVMDEHINMTVDVVRRISAELRPSVLDNLGLVAAIHWQIGEFKKRTGLETRLRVSPKDLEVDKERATAVFRVLQEALTNVARHADATRVSISLALGSGKLRLRVSDNGKGMAVDELDPIRALGIAGMRERARLWAGDVKIESEVGKGTVVVLEMPYAGNNPERGNHAEDTHRG